MRMAQTGVKDRTLCSKSNQKKPLTAFLLCGDLTVRLGVCVCVSVLLCESLCFESVFSDELSLFG